jgi:D-glucuronyl C5-epimerase C-terminus
VLVYDDGQVTRADDPYLPAADVVNAATGVARECSAGPAVASAAAVSVRKALRRAYDAGDIDRPTWTGYSDSYSEAKSAWHRLSGKRRTELGAVLSTVNQLAAGGQLTASRMVPAFLELDRNTEWWTHTSTTPPPTPTPGTPHKKTACTTAARIATTGPRVQFKGDPLTYQYYPGNGLRLQPLANWGAANALYNACKGINTAPGTPCEPDKLRALVDALIATAAHRGGFLAWEYYFPFGGGRPPWVSGIATGSALSALSHTSQLFAEQQQQQPAPAQPTGGTTSSSGLPPGSPSTALPPPDPAHYLDVAAQALPVYAHAAPLGIRATGPDGNHYLIYSFDKGLRVGNAFLESLTGLWDFWQASGDKTARALYVRGDREAKHELPLYDTGAWSLYSLGGAEADLNYQRMIRDFARGLCDRTDESAYCTKAAAWDADLHKPAVVAIVGPKTARAKKPTRIAIRVDKISCLSIQILSGQTVVYQPTWYFPRGVHSFTWVPPKPGSYHVHVLARDLAFRQSRADADLRVLSRH